MILAWATDIHLNFLDATGRAAFAELVRGTNADALLITGDIAEAPSVCRLLLELSSMARMPIYFNLGNHDFYHRSVGSVWDSIRSLCEATPSLVWLPGANTIGLNNGTAIIGVDGWADGRYGSWERSTVQLNDYVLIMELAHRSKRERLATMQRIADIDARLLREKLLAALEQYQHVIVATHVPPFREACWHEGKISGPDWLPHFACKATGDVMLEAAEAWPGRRIDVYCGHTHSAGTATIGPNLVVRTGGAEYGAPKIAGVIDV
jgi:Icc protein